MPADQGCCAILVLDQNPIWGAQTVFAQTLCKVGWDGHMDPHTFANREGPRARLSRSATARQLIRPWEDIKAGKPHWPSGTGCSARSKLEQRRLLKVQNCEVLGAI